MPQTHASAASAARTRAARQFFPGELVTKTATQSAGDPYEFVMSSDAIDRVGDIVMIDGIDLTSFKQNPIALWQHQADSPIGKWSNLRKEAGKLIGKLQLAAAGTSPLIDRLRSLIEQRILQAVSIGFRALEAVEIDRKDPWGGLIFTETELLECSLVSVPANGEALRIKGLSPHPEDSQIFVDPNARSSPGAAGAAARREQRTQVPLTPKPGAEKMTRTIAERIVAHQSRAVAIDDAINQINQAAANEDDRDFTEDEETRLAALAGEKTAVVRSIDTLTAQENALALKAQPAGGSARQRVEPRFAAKEVPGEIIGKMAAVATLAFLTGRSANDIIAERYRDDQRVKDCWDFTIRKTATNIADTLTPGWAAELVSHDVATFIDDLKNVSVFAALRGRPSSVDLTFDGAGSISIPRRTPGSLAGAWVGEAGVIPVLQGEIDAEIMTPTKLAGIVTFTRELQNASNSQIERILRDGLQEDTANVLDKALLASLPARPNVRPRGLLNGVTGIPSVPGDDADTIRQDIKNLVAPIYAAGGGRDIVLIMNPQAMLSIGSVTTLNGTPAFPEADQGRVGRYAVIESRNVVDDLLIAVDAADFVSAAGVPEYLASEHATLTMANADGTAPTQAIDSAGVIDVPGEVGPDLGIKVAGGAVGAGTANIVAMSMLQQYSIALRMVFPASWVMRRPEMVSAVTGFPA